MRNSYSKCILGLRSVGEKFISKNDFPLWLKSHALYVWKVVRIWVSWEDNGYFWFRVWEVLKNKINLLCFIWSLHLHKEKERKINWKQKHHVEEAIVTNTYLIFKVIDGNLWNGGGRWRFEFLFFFLKMKWIVVIILVPCLRGHPNKQMTWWKSWHIFRVNINLMFWTILTNES
jgi:hypothetical protein